MENSMKQKNLESTRGFVWQDSASRIWATPTLLTHCHLFFLNDLITNNLTMIIDQISIYITL